MINPDFDPLKTLEDLTYQHLELIQMVRALVESHNKLNHRLTHLENRFNQDN